MAKARHSSETYSVSTGHSATRSVTYDPAATRGARVLLEWNLEDLGDCLQHADDITHADLDWYLDRARRIFDNALHKQQGGDHGENS